MGGSESISSREASQDLQYEDAAGKYAASLERLARAYEADPEKRRDLVQEIHFQLWRSFARFDGRCSLRTWVYRVAHHVAASHVLRERRIFSTLVSLETLETLPDQSQGLEQIRQKVQELRAKSRHELLKNIMIPLIVVVFYGLGVWMPHTSAELKVFAVALVWSLAGQYFLHRGMWVATLPGDTTGLASYRFEIEHRRRILRNDLQWSFAPLFLAIGALILPNLSPGMLPFLNALFIWGVVVVAQRIQRQREFRKEIGALNEIERQNR